MSDQPLGSAAQEAARLLAHLQGWVGAPGGAGAAAGEPAPEPATAQAAPDAEPHAWSSCRVCPVCRALDAAHRTNPQLVEHLSAAVDHLVAAFGDLLPGAGGPDPAEPRTSREPREPVVRPPASRPRPRAERIVVERDDRPGVADDGVVGGDG